MRNGVISDMSYALRYFPVNNETCLLSLTAAVLAV